MAVLMVALGSPAGFSRDSPSKPKAKTSREPAPSTSEGSSNKKEEPAETPDKLEVATFGTGCFWCGEAVFQRVKGVESVVSGYSGGDVKNPSYHLVSTGLTGHAEVIQLTFDPKVISYDGLLDIFWKSHDPTKLDMQGIDVGPQYRSVIFYHSDEQKKLAEHSKQKLAKSHKVVTEISPFKAFYPAEDYHQNYFNNHPGEDYCQSIIRPKVMKAKKVFKDKMK
jgi:peptide-methionine (S)-S-oxide reductase